MIMIVSNKRYNKLVYAAIASIVRRNALITAWTTSTPQYTRSASQLPHLKSSQCGLLGCKKYPTSLFSTIVHEDNTKTTTTKEFNRADYPDNIILFDGICNFCNTWVDLLLRLDTQQKFKFAPLQSDIGKNLLVSIGKEEDDISSVLLIKQDGSFFNKSDCVLQVVKELGPIGNVFSLVSTKAVPIGFRNGVYDMVAENRYNFLGKRGECRYGDPKYFDRFIS